MPLSVSVSNLDTFRWWKSEEDLDMDWLLTRLRGEVETEAMRVGSAFHAALESATADATQLAADDVLFDINCDCDISLPTVREMPIEKMYGNLLVRGRIDGLIGNEVVDYKTTERFDADRLMEGYQWRFYLDMLGMDSFCWKVFVLREFGMGYEVRDFHTLRQNRYPGLSEDCARLAASFEAFAHDHPEVAREKELAIQF
jgi:hypothetical protein